MKRLRCDDIPSIEYMLGYLTDHGEQWRDIPATWAAVRAFLGY